MVQDNPFCPRCGARLQARAVEGLCPGCLLRAGMSSPGADDELGRLFPQFEVLELIGRGGMGSVYRARQRSLDREVAIKVLPSQLVDEPGFADRFAREAQALARLNHPHIVTIYDFGRTEGHCYLIMEYVTGVNLRQLLEQRRLEPAEALVLVPQLCDALQYAHDHGIVHRDIKPENILIDARGQVKVADFGLAKLKQRDDTGAPLTAPMQVMGTPRYMAPEQVEGSHAVDHRADIYSLGLVFYEMLTGELPMGRFDPPSEMAQVDVRLDEVVLKALSRAPERRYQHASEVKTAVETLDEHAAVADESVPETFMWAVLALVTPILAVAGAAWAGTWWPLLTLFLPGAVVGSFLASPKMTEGETSYVILVFFLCLSVVVATMWRLESASPMLGILVFLAGVSSGKEEERAKTEPSAEASTPAEE